MADAVVHEVVRHATVFCQIKVVVALRRSVERGVHYVLYLVVVGCNFRGGICVVATYKWVVVAFFDVVGYVVQRVNEVHPFAQIVAQVLRIYVGFVAKGESAEMCA